MYNYYCCSLVTIYWILIFLIFFQASVPDAVQELFKRILKGQSTEKYTPALRSFALTLNFYSPKAYEYVRQTFNKSLPDSSTISRWYRTVKCTPGFSQEALIALQLKVEEAASSNADVICSLIFDEMSIRKLVEWDGKQFTGYVDMGTEIDSDELPEAREVVVFMLVALNGSWKIPVAYFFINGLGGREKANLLVQCLEFVHESGVKVLSVTFDGAASNMTMASALGCNFTDAKNLKTWFAHPKTKEPVYIFLDPCHMIKLVRNCLASQKILQNGEGHDVSWEYIEKLVDVQKVKLRNRHLQWEQEKMRVCLATQTLS